MRPDGSGELDRRVTLLILEKSEAFKPELTNQLN